jgi:predicted kinase
MRTKGRPITSKLPRDEQLRRAKRAQRARQRLANLHEVQLTLPAEVAAKLAAARRAPQFVGQLEAALDRLVVRLGDYPQLRDLAWNRVDEFVPAREAFQLYERNWRLLDATTLQDDERALIARLKAEFGRGEINA